MKKLIVAGILVVSFSLSATAQSKKANTTPVKSEMTLMTPEFAAQKNVTDLTAFVSVNPEMKGILLEYFSHFINLTNIYAVNRWFKTQNFR